MSRVAQAAVVAALMIGLTNPPAHADSTIGDGSYTVPDQLPYGVYTAHADPRFNPAAPAACTFSTWSKAGKLIGSDGGSGSDTRIARILAPEVAQFITHGCTPWVRVG